jgi:hypothetical protein
MNYSEIFYRTFRTFIGHLSDIYRSNFRKELQKKAQNIAY